jgi:hypothetical protein
LFEIVLRYPDREEVRLTDRDPGADGHVRINGRIWRIIAANDGSAPGGVERRYIVRAVSPGTTSAAEISG